MGSTRQCAGLACIAVLLLLGSSTVLAGGSAENASLESVDATDHPEILDATYEGLAVVRFSDQTTYLFQNEPHALNVTTSAPDADVRVQVCLTAESATEREAPDELTPVAECTPETPVENDTEFTARFEHEEWPGDWSGEANVTLEFRVIADGNASVADRQHLSVRLLDPDVDLSGSGFTNTEEFAHGTDFQRADTDQDGLPDGEEVLSHGTDPLVRDSAGNGVPDGLEVLIGTNPTNPYTPHVFVLGFAIVISLGVGGLVVYFAPAQVFTPSSGTQDEVTLTPEERSLLTAEEHVLRLLAKRGNRMKQQVVVEEMGWSNAKVSRLLSEMEANGTIERVRIGRENIIKRESPRESLAVPIEEGER